MPDPPPTSSPHFKIERPLNDNLTLLATDPAGRRVVLKKLDDDCLLRDRIHPMVKDRLERIRQLAHLGVANLLSVHRHNDQPFLVWEYLEGQTLEEFLENPTRHINPQSLALELIRSIDALHTLGLVHGSLHPRNIILTSSNQLRLTHLSPLLYDDPAVDIESLYEILPHLGVALPDPPPQSLRHLATILSSPASPQPPPEQTLPKLNPRAIAAAILVAILAIAAALVIHRYTRP